MITHMTRSILSYKELLWNLIVRNLKIRYKNSSLGFFWTLLNPIFLILIYYFFIRLMRFQMNLTELLTGVIPWHFLTMTLGDSVDSISGNSSLITKVKFPRIILPLSTVTANLINYLLSLAVLILFLPLLGCPITLKLFLLFPIVLLTYTFVLGLSLFVATCNVYFKDTPHLLSIATMAWFFMTPIIYPLSMIPERFHYLAFLNPMTDLVCLYRNAFLGYPMPSTLWNAAGFLILGCCFFIGIFVFYRHEPTFADEL